jgi:hypothetical protein
MTPLTTKRQAAAAARKIADLLYQAGKYDDPAIDSLIDKAVDLALAGVSPMDAVGRVLAAV